MGREANLAVKVSGSGIRKKDLKGIKREGIEAMTGELVEREGTKEERGGRASGSRTARKEKGRTLGVTSTAMVSRSERTRREENVSGCRETEANEPTKTSPKANLKPWRYSLKNLIIDSLASTLLL